MGDFQEVMEFIRCADACLIDKKDGNLARIWLRATRFADWLLEVERNGGLHRKRPEALIGAALLLRLLKERPLDILDWRMMSAGVTALAVLESHPVTIGVRQMQPAEEWKLGGLKWTNRDGCHPGKTYEQYFVCSVNAMWSTMSELLDWLKGKHLHWPEMKALLRHRSRLLRIRRTGRARPCDEKALEEAFAFLLRLVWYTEDEHIITLAPILRRLSLDPLLNKVWPLGERAEKGEEWCEVLEKQLAILAALRRIENRGMLSLARPVFESLGRFENLRLCAQWLGSVAAVAATRDASLRKFGRAISIVRFRSKKKESYGLGKIEKNKLKEWYPKVGKLIAKSISGLRRLYKTKDRIVELHILRSPNEFRQATKEKLDWRMQWLEKIWDYRMQAINPRISPREFAIAYWCLTEGKKFSAEKMEDVDFIRRRAQHAWRDTGR